MEPRREETENRPQADEAQPVWAFDVLTRIAEAVEKLAVDPEVEIEASPPLCPSCGTLNPRMQLPPQEGGSGLMSEVVVTGICGVCNQTLFIVIESYSVHQEFRTAKEEIENKRRAGLFGDKSESV